MSVMILINNWHESTQVNLEANCNEYKTRLTDLEVSYESLGKKAKTREEELLSLLEESTAKRRKGMLFLYPC